MKLRILVLAGAVLVATYVGAMVTTELLNPTRTLVEPIELTPTVQESEEPRAGKRRQAEPGDRARRRNQSHGGQRPGSEPTTAAPEDDVGGEAEPVPALPPAPAGDSDEDDGDDDGGAGDDRGDD